MKITDIKIYTMDAFRTNWAFIKVETDEGLYGWGEATLGTQEMALEGCVADYKRLIIGRDPLEVERLLFEVYRDSYWKGGPVMMSALAGIEIACWDIAGKYRNVPVHALLGGKMRDKVKMYANAWFVGAREPADFAVAAKRTKALGIKAVKWDPFGKAHWTLSREEMDHAVAVVGAVRDAVARCRSRPASGFMGCMPGTTSCGRTAWTSRNRTSSTTWGYLPPRRWRQCARQITCR